MAFSKLHGTISKTTADIAGTEISTSVTGLSKYDWITLYATIKGPTGGTMDVIIQTEIATNVWADWAKFTQVAAAGTVSQSMSPAVAVSNMTVGIGTTAAPGVAIAAGSCVGGHPGDTIRAIFVSGAGTSAGKAQLIYVRGWCAK